MSKLSRAQRKAKTALTIKINGNKEITPPKDKILRDDEIDSTASIKDGGHEFEQSLGYLTELSVSDPKAFVALFQITQMIAEAMGDIDLSEYFKKDGSVLMTGDIDVNGNVLKNVNYLTDILNRSIIRTQNVLDGLGLYNVDGWRGDLRATNNSANRIWTFQDKDYTIAGLDDIAAAIVGVFKDQGNFTPSGSYPTNANTLLGDVPKKGYNWTISGLGVGVTALVGTKVVSDGDNIRVLIDNPGQTDANWSIVENNLQYTPENQANKDTDGTLSANSDIKYSSQKAVKTYVDALLALYGLPAFPTPDGKEWILRVVDGIVSWVINVDAEGTDISVINKLQANGVGDWGSDGVYVGATSLPIVIGTDCQPGESFDGTEDGTGTRYTYNCKTSGWTRNLIQI